MTKKNAQQTTVVETTQTTSKPEQKPRKSFVVTKVISYGNKGKTAQIIGQLDGGPAKTFHAKHRFGGWTVVGMSPDDIRIAKMPGEE